MEAGLVAVYQSIGNPDDRVPARQFNGDYEPFELWLLSLGMIGGCQHLGIDPGDWVVRKAEPEILSDAEFCAQYEPVPDALEAQRAAAKAG